MRLQAGMARVQFQQAERLADLLAQANLGGGGGQRVQLRGGLVGVAPVPFGFGEGALVTVPVATRLIQSIGALHTFAYLGIAFLVVTVVSGYFMQNPPENWKPEGWRPTASQASQRAAREYSLGGALKTWQWWVLWLLLFLNTSAGISVISQESPLFQELAGVSAVLAAGMVGVVSIGNAFGRVFWAWVSDLIPRRPPFFLIFLSPVFDRKSTPLNSI